jgi:C4-type Zn-finger protein
VKIISEPDYTTWTYSFTCSVCSSKLHADHTDLKYRLQKKWVSDAYGDGGDYQKVDHFYVVCPTCDSETELNPYDIQTNIPYLLRMKVKKAK